MFKKGSIPLCLQCTVYGVKYSTQYSIHCTVYSTVYNVQYSIQFTVQYTVYSTIYSVQYNIQCTVQCTLYIVQYCLHLPTGFVNRPFLLPVRTVYSVPNTFTLMHQYPRCTPVPSVYTSTLGVQITLQTHKLCLQRPGLFTNGPASGVPSREGVGCPLSS